MNDETIWSLAWYSYEDDSLIGAQALDIVDDDARRMFNQGPDVDITAAFVVTQDKVTELERLTGLEIDIEAYEYFVEARAAS